jgi:hypothetical protein
MDSNYMKKCSLVIKQLKIKTTHKVHLAPVRIAIIKGNSNKKCWQRCGKIETLLMGVQIIANTMEIPQKIRHRTPI